MTRKILNADLSQAELRVMAIMSEDPWMREALQEGAGDFFDNHLMPTAYPFILMDYSSVQAYKEADPVQHKEGRTKVKAVVYGLSFGRQAKAIAQSLDMPVNEAQYIMDNFLGAANKLDEWRNKVMEAAVTPSKRDFLVNPFGRKFQSEIITTRNFRNIQREALSFLPQSTSSDIMLATAIRINPTIKALDCKVINLVHDALMVEGEETALAELGPYINKELRRTGEMVLGDSVPFLSDFSIGNSWADLD